MDPFTFIIGLILASLSIAGVLFIVVCCEWAVAVPDPDEGEADAGAEWWG